MPGKSLALTPRDRALVMEVLRHGALTREQMMRLGLFGSKTRANARLRRLTSHEYLMTRRQPLLAGGPRLVYFPGPASTDVGRTTRLPRASELFLDHHLGVVDLRIAFETQTTVTRWLSDKELTGLALGLVPDGYVEWTADGLTYCAFLEYDRGTEPLGRLEQKVRGYVELAMSGRFARTFQRKFFRTLFVTDTAGRLTTMRRAVAHVTDRIVRLTTRSLLIAQGPFAPIWARPGVDQALSFIHD